MQNAACVSTATFVGYLQFSDDDAATSLTNVPGSSATVVPWYQVLRYGASTRYLVLEYRYQEWYQEWYGTRTQSKYLVLVGYWYCTTSSTRYSTWYPGTWYLVVASSTWYLVSW